MSQLEVLILELLTVDALASSAIMVGEVTTLTHEVGDDTVERTSLVAESLFSGTECPEVLSGLGDNIIPQLHRNTANGLVISRHIEKHTNWHFAGVTG